jgi:hypothetical protein
MLGRVRHRVLAVNLLETVRAVRLFATASKVIAEPTALRRVVSANVLRSNLSLI